MKPILQAAFLWMAVACATPAVDPAAASTKAGGQVLVPAGEWVPFLREDRGPDVIRVPAFWIDRLPVTKGEYLDFVIQNPGWRRSQVRRLFADPGYLLEWRSDLDPGTNGPAGLRQPVTGVSWFAARAFAAWKGLRLPSTAEWERVAAIGFTNRSGALDTEFLAALDRWYGGVAPAESPGVGAGRSNLLGIHDLHGLIWEWTSDFNSIFVTGDARNDSGVDRSLFCAGGALSARDRNDYATFMRYGFRSSLKAAYTVHNLGFRCARDP